jgi:hypothetical protein
VKLCEDRNDGGRPDGRPRSDVTIVGEACACPDVTAPTTPGVVLDPFGGTGTTATVAKALGRHGITVDMSADYCRVARWRTTDEAQLIKAAGGKPKPARKVKPKPAEPAPIRQPTRNRPLPLQLGLEFGDPA